MEEDNEYLKLPLDERCVHKLWKARLNGYEEATKLFRQIDDDKSPEFSKYLGLVKKFVVDSNAVAQEKALEAVLAYVENYALAGKSVGEVMSGIVGKCIAAPKTKTKELAIQVALMYVEIEKQEAVQEELMKGMEHKNPKIVAACISATTQALREFGAKVISVKPLVKKMTTLLEDRDKAVREEAKLMVVEIFRWIGPALKPQLASLKPVKVTELEAEFEKVMKDKAVPTRYLKSQKIKQEEAAAAAAADDGEEGDEEADDVNEIDTYDLMDPVDIISKLPKDFYEKVEAKKWQERKEAVDALEQLLQAPKLESGDYGDMVRALKKIISKDTNVMVIAVAGKCLAGLANGLKKRFQPYAGACIPAILEKFREKKQNVVLALREAIDAIYQSTTIEAILEDVLAALENKNPSVKAETASFLARSFTRCTPQMLSKKLLKAYTAALLKTLNEPDPTVRDNSAEALGTAMKAVGEKAIMPFMTDVDNLKLIKIKECCEKAVMLVKVSKVVERPSSAPVKAQQSKVSQKAGSSAPKPVKRPGSAVVAPKKQPARKPGPLPPGAKGKVLPKQMEKELSPEDVDEKACEMFPEEVMKGLGDANWKTRLAAVEQLTEILKSLDAIDVPSQVVIRILNKKPGLRDTNIQVAKARMETVKYVAETVQMSSMVLDYCLTEIVERLGDPKTTAQAGETLSALAEATKLDIVATSVLNYAFAQKSPKLHQESLNWVSSAILEFGFVIQPKPLVDIVKKALAATNPVVRNSSISLLGTLYLYMGDDLRMLFDTEKPALQQQIFAEFDKHAGDAPPAPTRGLSRSAKAADDGEEDGEFEDDDGEAAQSVNVRELMPRVDISTQITDSLITELVDKDWKVRNEAIQKLSGILTKEKFVTNSLGELPPVLAKRLVDSNGKIAVAAFALCQQLGVAMGAQGKTHIRTFFPGLLQGMGDSKAWVRSAALGCINTWGEQCGFKEFFDGEMVADALRSGSPALRSELWSWLAEKLPAIPAKSIPKEELQACVSMLYANLEDRNSDVRKSAQEAVLGFMMHLGYESMMRATEKLQSFSSTSVRTILENVYPNLPTKSQPKKKMDASVAVENARTVKGGTSKPVGTKIGTKGKVVTKAGRKKDDDVDTSPLLQANNLKHQRSLDEHKLKVLKWNFTTPREEFVELLRDQMTVANINKSLIANMMHSDFKFHLKAIDSLAEDLPANPAATISNLDLILKWMTLRFFDTNPSVLLKGLEYLQTVFNVLIEEHYNMFDLEASSFLPYLILKIGDPKDAVRIGVRALFTQIQNVYPASKLFAYVMEGLKSKNARQRTECLDLLGSLIESYGLPVCQPSAGVAMKEVARQISDRDNSVRNAALNCIVQAYFLEGEKVYKLVGQISDKDMSLLEERIKRASKNRPPAHAVQPPVVRQTHVVQPIKHEPEQVCEEPANAAVVAPVEISDPAPIMRTTLPKPRPMSGPFGLDMNLLERIESNGVELRAPKLQEFDYEFLGALPAVSQPSKAALRTCQQPVHVSERRSLGSCGEEALDVAISNLKTPDVKLYQEALAQLDGLVQSNKATLLSDQADQLVSAIVMQLHLLTNNRLATDAKQMPVCYRMSIMLLLSFFNNEQLARKVSRDVLKDLVEEVLTILVEGRMEELDFSDQAIRVINLTVVRAIEKSDHTNATCALITLLHEAVGNRSSTRFLDLAMKCLWKVIKLLPKWDGEIQYDVVLYEIHRFFKEYPPAMWKKQASDTPLRTLKTILHTLVKMKGDKIYSYLGRINNLQESDLYAYLQKLTRTMKQDDGKHLKKETKSQHRLSKSVHEQLSEIFKKIGSKEDSKVGLALLYDFRDQHPEADIEPFLRKSSQFFQDYIEQGLQQIEKERSKQLGRDEVMATSSASSLGSADSMLTRSGESVGTTVPNSKSCATSDSTEDCDPLGKNASYYRERLRHLQAGAGLDPSALLPAPKTSGNNEFDININRKPHVDRNDPLQLNRSQASTVDVENIRKRLEALKTAIKS